MKLNIQSPAKKLRTKYKFCVMDVDAKRRGEGGEGRGVGSNRTPADNGRSGVKNLQNLADVIYGWPLRKFWI